MFCTNCGSALDEDADRMNYCHKCGAKVERSKRSGAPISQSSKQEENEKKGIKGGYLIL